MDRLEHELVSLRNGKQYFVLEEVLYEYDTYNLVLNVEDENDIKIVLQEIKNGKTVLSPVEDKRVLSNLSSIFEDKIRKTQENL